MYRDVFSLWCPVSHWHRRFCAEKKEWEKERETFLPLFILPKIKKTSWRAAAKITWRVRVSTSAVCGTVFVRMCVAVWFGGWRYGSWCSAFSALQPLPFSVRSSKVRNDYRHCDDLFGNVLIPFFCCLACLRPLLHVGPMVGRSDTESRTSFSSPVMTDASPLPALPPSFPLFP